MPDTRNDIRNADYYERRRNREDAHQLALLKIQIDALHTLIGDKADDMHDGKPATDLLGYLEDMAADCQFEIDRLDPREPDTMARDESRALLAGVL